MKAIVADRGQVTIPKALRDRLGITPRTVLEFREEKGKLVAEKVDANDSVSRVYGCAKSGRRTDEIIAEMRDGW